MDAYVLADVVGIIFFSKFSCNQFHAPVIIFSKYSIYVSKVAVSSKAEKNVNLSDRDICPGCCTVPLSRTKSMNSFFIKQSARVVHCATDKTLLSH